MTQRNTTADIWARVDQRADDECWPWKMRPDKQGYAIFWCGGKRAKAHNVIYELMVGPIPKGHVVDHLCHTTACELSGSTDPKCPHRSCLNWHHLVAATQLDNTMRGNSPHAQHARKTSCPKCGGPYTTLGDGTRRCYACTNSRRRA